MPINRTVNFSGQQAKTLGGSYPPRGLYKIRTTKVDETQSTNGNLQGMEFTGTIMEMYVPQNADGKEQLVSSQARINDEMRKLIIWYPDGKSEGGDKAREAEIKAALVAHGAPREHVNSAQGAISLSDSDFVNKDAWVMYDPPPAGTREYPEWQFVGPDEAQKVLSGKAKVSWPYANYVHGAKKAAENTRAAQNTGAGSMMPSGFQGNAGGGFQGNANGGQSASAAGAVAGFTGNQGAAAVPGQTPPNGAGAAAASPNQGASRWG